MFFGTAGAVRTYCQYGAVMAAARILFTVTASFLKIFCALYGRLRCQKKIGNPNTLFNEAKSHSRKSRNKRGCV